MDGLQTMVPQLGMLHAERERVLGPEGPWLLLWPVAGTTWSLPLHL